MPLRPTPNPAAVALGSNLGDRRALIESAFAALSRLPGTTLLARAPIIQTPAQARPGVDPGGPYLNTAATLRTSLSPHDLLAHLHAIERSLGRIRENTPPWSPRTIDLDLLLFADQVIHSPLSPSSPELIVPHPRLAQRRFVLEPLAAIAPEWIVPTSGKTVAQLLSALTVE